MSRRDERVRPTTEAKIFPSRPPQDLIMSIPNAHELYLALKYKLDGVNQEQIQAPIPWHRRYAAPPPSPSAAVNSNHVPVPETRCCSSSNHMMDFRYASNDIAEDDEEEFARDKKKSAVKSEDVKKPAVKIKREDMASSGSFRGDFRSADNLLSNTRKVEDIPKKEEMTEEDVKKDIKGETEEKMTKEETKEEI